MVYDDARLDAQGDILDLLGSIVEWYFIYSNQESVVRYLFLKKREQATGNGK